MTFYFDVKSHLVIVLVKGEAAKIFQKNAIGKLSAVVCNQTAINSVPAFLKSKVAARLMLGHIRHTVMDEMARMIMIGLSFAGFTIRNAIFLDKLP